MTKYDQDTIRIAVAVLREVMETPGKDQRPSEAIRLALRVLLPHCPERWPLTQFWDGINGTHDIGRSQTVTAAFNGILHQLRNSGAYHPDQKLRGPGDRP